MDKLVEDITLRDRFHVFKDREEAGRLLSESLINYKGSEGIILGIPSGGIPVAAQIAHALGLPMDVIVVRKIPIPYNTEAGFGAMAPDNKVILNERLLRHLRLTEDEIHMQMKKTEEVIKKRLQIFKGKTPPPDLRNKDVLLVDDGLASGYTMLAAIGFVQRRKPKKIIVAVPTGLDRTVDLILPEVDEIVCLNVRSGVTFAVADAYRNWHDLTDEEVISIMKKYAGNQAQTGK